MIWRVCYRVVQRTMATASGTENRLGSQLSPYLRQHKDNPVAWFPWGDEAIRKAKEENKMIFLSIGYSTCHWCHVMERESFENAEMAQIMNRDFINVKVDREERPDVDKVYMTFVQATTGGGGWPLSIFLTPSLHPIFGGTYFPPEGNYGRPGFKQILNAMAQRWGEDSEEMSEQGGQVLSILDKQLGASSLTPQSSLPDPAILSKFYSQLNSRHDPEYGGFSKAPKFPQPSNLLTLFRLHSWVGQTPDRRKRGLEMMLRTLDMMDKGGIHDHISQGFARYSTDQMWHVPHFEKMLYDQAQLVMAYTSAALVTDTSRYKEVVEDIVTYVKRDLTHSKGGFYSAEDADSLPTSDSHHKKEGAFCVWTWEEIQALLGQEEVEGHSLASVVKHEYNMVEGGNVSRHQDPHGELEGQNVLTKLPCKDPLFEKAKYDSALEKANKIMFEARLKRPRPGLDSKLLCSWNSLMISSLARAGTSLGEDKYVDIALKAAAFLKEYMIDQESGNLLRSVYGVEDKIEQLEKPIEGFIDDYVFTVQACLDLYNSTFSSSWLDLAIKLQQKQDELFLDQDNGGYFASQAGDPDIVLRLKDDQDGAEPCSNSVACMNLLRLGRLVNDPSYLAQGEKILKLFGSRLSQLPLALPAMVEAYLFHHEALPILVVTGQTDRSHPLLTWVRTRHLPSLCVLHLGKAGGLVRTRHPALATLVEEESQAGFLITDGRLGEKIETGERLEELLKQ